MKRDLNERTSETISHFTHDETEKNAFYLIQLEREIHIRANVFPHALFNLGFRYVVGYDERQTKNSGQHPHNVRASASFI